MFKPGQIWDRTHMSGVVQIAVIVAEDKVKYKVFVLSGERYGEFCDWSIKRSYAALAEGRLVQLA